MRPAAAVEEELRRAQLPDPAPARAAPARREPRVQQAEEAAVERDVAGGPVEGLPVKLAARGMNVALQSWRADRTGDPHAPAHDAGEPGHESREEEPTQ